MKLDLCKKSIFFIIILKMLNVILKPDSANEDP